MKKMIRAVLTVEFNEDSKTIYSALGISEEQLSKITKLLLELHDKSKTYSETIYQILITPSLNGAEKVFALVILKGTAKKIASIQVGDFVKGLLKNMGGME